MTWRTMKNVYLVGMMGSGKTTTGKALAKLLNMPFVDLDERIVERAGQSINDIFKTHGEPHFRKLESELLKQIASESGQVVATGGGIVLDPKNAEILKKVRPTIYLKTSLDVLWERVKRKRDRPLLQAPDPQKTLASLLAEREPLYQQVANMTYFTDRKTPEEVANEIFETYFQ